MAPLKRLIIERTGGNPFFIEEMLQGLFDEGALVRNGVVKVARPLAQLRLPPTVQGILASRIDRQPGEHKQLLQTLAVMGKESRLGLIRHVVPTGEAQLERMLADLQADEFIYEQPVLTDAEYVFKHALTQEVAYNSLLIERRKVLHERAGQALESLFAGQLDDHVSELARHYGSSDNASKAVEYLGRAGQQAIRRSAPTDAISSLTAAIDLLPRLPDGPERIQRELMLRLAIGPVLLTVRGFNAPDAEWSYTRVRELCTRLGDPPQLFPALWGLWFIRQLRGEFLLAHELAEQLLRQAQSANDPVLLLYAHHALGETLPHLGELLRSREHLETAISLYNRERPLDFRYGGFDAGVHCLSLAAPTLMLLGYPDQALKRMNEALALAQDLSHAFSLASAELVAGFLHSFRGDVRAAQASAERLAALSAEHGFAVFGPSPAIVRGWAMAKQGRHAEGIMQRQEGMAASRARGSSLVQPAFLFLFADACTEAGRFDDALSALTEALALTDENYAEAHRLKGELLLAQDHSRTAEAQDCFELAITIARKQSAKWPELLATTSLARLLRHTGRREEARAMLAEIYGWFTEGFDTADLKDAKALLAELTG